jgi:hypothetical protein
MFPNYERVRVELRYRDLECLADDMHVDTVGTSVSEAGFFHTLRCISTGSPGAHKVERPDSAKAVQSKHL